MNGGKLIAVNKSRYFQKSSQLALGTGAFVSGLEFSADCRAHVVGKPSKQFFEIGKNFEYHQCKNIFLAAKRFNDVPIDEILMVGDDIRDDVIGKKC